MSPAGMFVTAVVGALDLATGKWRELLEDASDARYIPTGHIVFLRQGTLMAAPFDPGRGRLTGTPAPAVAGIVHALNTGSSINSSGSGQFAVSRAGASAS